MVTIIIVQGRLPGMRDLTIDDLRNRFLRPSVSPGGENLRSCATTLISYTLEWDFRNMLFDISPVQGTAEPFFLHLFKGCVLFESILKANPTKVPPTTCTLGNALQYLHRELGISANINIGNIDFPSIISNLPTADDSIQTGCQVYRHD